MISYAPDGAVALEPPSLAHLLALTDGTGTIQHATFDVPNRSTGYCTDDIARALMVAIRAGRVSRRERTPALELARTSLAFLDHAQIADGRFHNFMSYERTWLDDAGGEDSNGRAIWALGFAVRSAPTFGFRAFACEMLRRALPQIATFTHLRSRAFASLGILEALAAIDEGGTPGVAPRRELEARLAALAAALRDAYRAEAGPGWQWFEPVMTYDNARLCEALIRSGDALNDEELLEIGATALAFFERSTVSHGTFDPVGNDGWYPRGGTRSTDGQQPLEAAALIDAALAGARVAARRPNARMASVAEYEALARCGLAWFSGANRLGRSLVTAHGACADGIETSGVSMNAGAESTLAYLAAAYTMAEFSST